MLDLKSVIDEAKDGAKLTRGMGRPAIAARFDQIAERLQAIEAAKPVMAKTWRVWLDKDGHITSHPPYLPTSPIEWFAVNRAATQSEKVG